MENWLLRSMDLYTENGYNRLKNAKVALLGLGGVGGACAEALVRGGVGSVLLVDNDVVDITNINRQIIAHTQNVGQQKTEAFKQRLTLINPECKIDIASTFYLPENSSFLYEYQPSFVIDAIDTLTAKLHIAETCHNNNIPHISCMGTGNRMHPESFLVGKISDTSGSGCPLARVMRRELKRRGVEDVNVLYSKEMPYKSVVEKTAHGKNSPSSVSFVPPVAGYIMAGYAIRFLLSEGD